MRVMTCKQCTDRLVSWLEARWDGEGEALPAQLLEHAAACPSCAARLEAARSLCEGPSRRPAPPPELAQSIRRRLAGERAAPRSLWRPALRWGLLPLAAALAAAVGTAALFGAFGPRASGTRGRSPAGDPTVVVRFVLQAPEARQVSLVGDWNQWDPGAQPLRDADGDGVWEIEVPLRRGAEHQYQFLVDGALWIPDPNAALKVDDGMGGYNSVLQI